MTTSIALNDLPRLDSLSAQDARGVRGGVAESFLFRGRPQAGPGITNSITNFNIGALTVNNIDTFYDQTNNLTQLNLVNVDARGGSRVDVDVEQDLIGSNEFR